MSPLFIAVQIASENSSLTLFQQERTDISTKCLQHDLQVFWLPGLSNNREGCGNSISSEILIFVSGIAFAGLIKPLYDGFAKEAGKDIWLGLKELVARIWKAQTDKGYCNNTRVKFVFELGDEHAAIRFDLPTSYRHQREPLEHFELHVQSVLYEIQQDWDDIQTTVIKHRVGIHQPGLIQYKKQIHVICKNKDGRWIINPANGVSFYVETIHVTGDHLKQKYS